MTKKDIMSIALKVIGIYTIVNLILYIPMLVMSISMIFSRRSNFLDSGLILHFIPSLLYPILALIVAYILLRYTDRISQKLITNDSKISLAENIPWGKSIFELSLKIIGIVLFVNGGAKMINALANWANRAITHGSITETFRLVPTYGIFGSLFYLVFAWYLVGNGKYIVNFAYRDFKDL